jgi:hypothetical protein
MTFDNDNFGAWSATGSANAGNAYLYKNTADTLATIAGSGYFNDIIQRLAINDVIHAVGSDASATLIVTSVTTNVTVSILARSGSAYYVAFAGEHTTVGGAAAEAITVTGVLATDLAIATLHTVGAAPQTIVTTVASADTVTVTFSANPSNDHVVTYVVYRAI